MRPRPTWALMALLLCGCPNVGEMLRQYGFTEVRPPSPLFAPGTVVWVQHRHPFSAGVICTHDESLGEGHIQSQVPTISRELRELTHDALKVGVDFVKVVHGDEGLEDIEDISVRLTRPRIDSLNDIDIAHHARKRSADCRAAIAARRAAGYTISMISSALRADVTYTATFRHASALSASARLEVMNNLAVRLGLEHSETTSTTISGQGLYWGITDDAYLAHQAEVLSPPPPMARHVHPKGKTALRLLTSDAPLALDTLPDVGVPPGLFR